MKPKQVTWNVVLFLALAMSTAQALTIEANTSTTNWLYFDPCEGGLTSGGTWLIDYGMPGQKLYEPLLGNETVNWGPNVTSYIQDSLESTYSGWDYVYADETLQGTLWIDWYKAVDMENAARCRHGAQISTHYIAASGEAGLNLDWIQLYTESGGSGTDRYKVDGNEAGDTSPAYFTATDVRSDYIYVPNPGGLIFGDSPYDSHLESLAWSGGVEFTLLLASFDTDNSRITIYDGINWGYQGECVVPEPLSVSMMGIGLFMLCFRNVRKV